jgi:hypothetical protein
VRLAVNVGSQVHDYDVRGEATESATDRRPFHTLHHAQIGCGRGCDSAGRARADERVNLAAANQLHANHDGGLAFLTYRCCRRLSLHNRFCRVHAPHQVRRHTLLSQLLSNNIFPPHKDDINLTRSSGSGRPLHYLAGGIVAPHGVNSHSHPARRL